jgi:hypothetical protein
MQMRGREARPGMVSGSRPGGPVSPEAGGGVGTERDALTGVDPGSNSDPQASEDPEQDGNENSARSRPWRRPSSETKNAASSVEATINRNAFGANSKTVRRSNEEPNQNWSMQKTEREEMEWRCSWRTTMCTGDGANRGEPGATGEQTLVLKL